MHATTSLSVQQAQGPCWSLESRTQIRAESQPWLADLQPYLSQLLDCINGLVGASVSAYNRL